MHVGHQQEPHGNNRRKHGKVTGISTPLALRRPWQILAVLAALFVPASGLIFAQSGFVPFSNSIIALDASPDDASIVVAGTLNVPVPAGIYRSTDGGHTWSRANADLPPDTSVASIRFDPLDGNRVLAADGGVGNLFISEDGGLTGGRSPRSARYSPLTAALAAFLRASRTDRPSSTPAPAMTVSCAALTAA